MAKTHGDGIEGPVDERLQQAILRTIAYADVFDFPLTSPEVHRYLEGVKAAPETVQAALAELCENGRLCAVDGAYLFPGRQAIAETRQHRQAVAARLWPQAIAWGRRIAGLPFVRMIAVTGALAVNNVEEGTDIDYFIITQPRRLWLCRGLIVVLVHQARQAGVTLCPNYLLTERSLAFPDRSLYVAHELAQMVPLHGLNLYERLRRINAWTTQFLPNAGLHAGQAAQAELTRREQWWQGLAESLLRTPPGAWLESWEMERKIRKFQFNGLASAGMDHACQPAAGNTETAFSADCCKGHFNAHGQATLDSYAVRLQNLPEVQPTWRGVP